MSKNRKLRVVAKNSPDGWEKTQYLQELTRHGWITIDEEEVPRPVIISLGCFGDTGGWVTNSTFNI